MTFRVGQKVVCVVASHRWAIDDGFPRPKAGAVYTVEAIDDCSPTSLFLAELFTDACQPSYWASGFRPLVERKTDISCFTSMLNLSKQKERT